MIKTTTREIASSSDVNAPVFRFRKFVRSPQEPYHNNGQFIDFVTDGDSLYVPSTDNVMPCKDSIEEDGGFMRLVSKGKQGIQGLKGDPGRDGRTPSVFARFDGRQMIFYTNEINDDGTPKIDDNGNPVTRRIAATNDLTGPSWRPKKVDDTIIWEKTRDDSQPESINLSDLVKETAPVIFRVDSDNTKRSDETSGPANYIQWKYEGDEYWNNLISISELMNLALAGFCIWFDETDQEYHLGHRQVLHATYDSSKSGKRIISDVEHGDVLYDAGPIHLPDFEADIAALWEEVCALKDRVDAIEEELPKFVKAVIINDKLNKPDEDGVVDLGAFDFYTKEESDEKFQPVGDYIKKSDLKFEVRNEENGRFLYMSLDNGSTWTKIYEATCVCKKEEDPTVYYTIFFETPTPSTATMTYSGTVKYPGSQVRVPAGTTVVLEADAEGYKHYKETKLINADYHFAPVLTEESAPEVKYSACVIDDTGLADRIYIGTTSANKQQACLENLSNGTTVYGKATRSGYKDKTVSGVINNDDLELHITGEWESSSISVTGVSINDGKNYTMCLGDAITHTFKATVTPSNATNKSVKWRSVNPEYLTINETTGLATPKKTTDTLSTGYVTVIARTDDGGHEAECKVVIEDCSEPGPTTYTVGVRNNSSCPADTMYLSLDEHDFEDHKTTLNVPSGTVVYMQAAKEGYNYQTLSHPITDNYTFTPTCDWEWGGEFEVNDGNDIHINVGDCVELSELITYTPSDYVPESVTFEKGEDEYSNAISVTETGKVCGLSETTRAASVRVTINDKHLVWVNVWVGGGTHLYNLKVTQQSVPGQPMPTDSDIKVYVDGVAHTYTDHALTFDVAEGTPIKVTASKEGWVANIDNEDRDEYLFDMPANDETVIIAWSQNKYTLSVTSNTPSGAENPDVVINGVTYSDVSTTVQRQIGHGNSVNITASLSGYTPAYKDHDTGTTITIPFTMIKNTWVDIDWSADTISVTGISLNKNTMALTYASCDGNTYGNTTGTLTATISPSNASNKGVTWSSGNTSVATVNTSGVITAKGVGKATITAAAQGDMSKKATCTVTVTAASVTTSTISLNKQSTELTVGGTETLTVIRTPSCATDTISWTSSNTNIATVSGGEVEAKAPGTTTITAKANGKTATCTVTVKTAAVDVTSVEITNCGGAIRIDETTTLGVTVEPDNATNKNVTWSSDDTAIATVENGVVTGKGVGQTIIRATSVSNSSATNTCVVNVRNKTVPIQISNDVNCPADKIYINGNEYNYADSANWIYVEPGISVTMKATRSGYNDIEKTKTMTATDHMFTINCSDWEEQITTKCVTSINVKSNKDFITLESGNNTLQMTAEIEPSDATNKEVTWESNFTDRATVDQNGKVTGVAPGIVIIKATAKDECGVSGSKAITVGKPITIINAMPNTYDFGINDAVDVDTPRYVLAGQTNTYYVDGTNANSAITVKVRDGQDLTNKYIGYTSNCSAIADSTTPEKLRSNGKITGFNYCDNITITLSVIDNA